MTQYIDKAAIVAEIKKKLDKHNKLQSFNYGAVKDLESLLKFLDTLEVKEVESKKACEWLEKNKDNSLIKSEDSYLSGYLTDEFIKEFKQAMKGE